MVSKESFSDCLARASKPLILDGAMGTMIQARRFTEADFRGDIFTSHPCSLAGCNDVLSVTRPDDIADIHLQYIRSGARIITTNSFNSNPVSLSEYGLQDYAAEISRAAVAVARQAVIMARSPESVYIAGSIGPTNKSLSLGADISFDTLHEAYLTQAEALIDAGADLLLIETIFDTLNAKAALTGAREAMVKLGREIPVILSVTLTENGRTLSGQTLEAFVASVSYCRPAAIGLNCGFGPEQLSPYLSRLSSFGIPLSFHPNAGLPDAYGNYVLGPEKFAAEVRRAVESTAVRIVGGCCGTTPAHIFALAGALDDFVCPPLTPQPQPATLVLSGLEPMPLPSSPGTLNRIGERCNVAGSRKFLRLIKEGKLDEAVGIARAQVEAGAKVLDINLDDGMLDTKAEMIRFLDALAADTVAAAVPVMIDSSSAEVICESLRHIQGKCIVNSISLKDGEEQFLDRARYIRSFGAAVVVMAMDEQGQAETFDRKLGIARRAYSLLTREVEFPPEDIVFDPNVLTIATGIADHCDYAVDFLRAAESIKAEMPGVHVSGGISNLSFAFRGIEPVRKAMHAEFISLAKGLDMAIVNPAASLDPKDNPEPLRKAVRDVILNTNPEATERLTRMASEIKAEADARKAASSPAPAAAPLPAAPADPLAEKIIHGNARGLDELILKRLEAGEKPLDIVEGSLMDGIGTVGRLFGEGQIFLPQVVRSADAMQRAVDILAPYISASGSADSPVRRMPRVVLATVKGDVHDIGKNIVAILLRCNGFEVIDLGTKQPAEAIIGAARGHQADIIALSGLITPSLQEMVNVAQAMHQAGLRIPLFVGGAATSPEYAAVRIAPVCDSPVFHTREAAALPPLAKAWLDPATRAITEERLRDSQQALRDSFSAKSQPLMSLGRSRACAPAPFTAPDPLALGVACGTIDFDIPISEVVPLVNWRQFMAVWHIDASLAAVADIKGCDHCRAQWLAAVPVDKRPKASEAMQLHKDASRLLDSLAAKGAVVRARAVTVEAHRRADDIILSSPEGGEPVVIPTLRRQRADDQTSGRSIALADYVAEADDRITLFAVTAGSAIRESVAGADGQYASLIARAVADRLAEAATEWLHRRINGGKGIRPAIGYQSLPDQSLIFEADKVLKFSELDIALTENGAMDPEASTAGMIIHRPEAAYFTVGDIDEEQFADYCVRRGIPADRMKAFLRRRQ